MYGVRRHGETRGVHPQEGQGLARDEFNDDSRRRNDDDRINHDDRVNHDNRGDHDNPGLRTGRLDHAEPGRTRRGRDALVEKVGSSRTCNARDLIGRGGGRGDGRRS
jgi:hypothetical protein